MLPILISIPVWDFMMPVAEIGIAKNSFYNNNLFKEGKKRNRYEIAPPNAGQDRNKDSKDAL